jgi:hypothetical protein
MFPLHNWQTCALQLCEQAKPPLLAGCIGPPDARSNHSLKDFFANLVACVVFTQPEERIFEFTHQDGWMHPSIENTNQAWKIFLPPCPVFLLNALEVEAVFPLGLPNNSVRMSWNMGMQPTYGNLRPQSCKCGSWLVAASSKIVIWSPKAQYIYTDIYSIQASISFDGIVWQYLFAICPDQGILSTAFNIRKPMPGSCVAAGALFGLASVMAVWSRQDQLVTHEGLPCLALRDWINAINHPQNHHQWMV